MIYNKKVQLQSIILLFPRHLFPRFTCICTDTDVFHIQFLSLLILILILSHFILFLPFYILKYSFFNLLQKSQQISLTCLIHQYMYFVNQNVHQEIPHITACILPHATVKSFTRYNYKLKIWVREWWKLNTVNTNKQKTSCNTVNLLSHSTPSDTKNSE